MLKRALFLEFPAIHVKVERNLLEQKVAWTISWYMAFVICICGALCRCFYLASSRNLCLSSLMLVNSTLMYMGASVLRTV
jgi:hypothetical protein